MGWLILSVSHSRDWVHSASAACLLEAVFACPLMLSRCSRLLLCAGAPCRESRGRRLSGSECLSLAGCSSGSSVRMHRCSVDCHMSCGLWQQSSLKLHREGFGGFSQFCLGWPSQAGLVRRPAASFARNLARQANKHHKVDFASAETEDEDGEVSDKAHANF